MPKNIVAALLLMFFLATLDACDFGDLTLNAQFTEISGLATGGVYGLIALGFVLIYKATSVLNLAMGDFMTLGANRRIPVEMEGLKLVSFLPENDVKNGLKC